MPVPDMLQFVSTDDGFFAIVHLEIIGQCSFLVDMIKAAIFTGQDLGYPFYLNLNGKTMDKAFTYGEKHKFEDFTDSVEENMDIILTPADCDLFAICEQFTYDDLTSLLQGAIYLGYDQLKIAVGEYIRRIHEKEVMVNNWSIRLDLDSDDELAPNELEELRLKYKYLLQD